MPLNTQSDRVTGYAALKTSQLSPVSCRVAAHFVEHSSSVDFLSSSGETLCCRVGQVVIFLGSLCNQHCGRLRRTSPMLPGSHRKKMCLIGCTPQLFLFASFFFAILCVQLSDRGTHYPRCS